VSGQICILLALNGGLFDPIALQQMKKATTALGDAMELMPPDILDRLDSSEKLQDKDRELILQLAKQTLGNRSEP
jgi:F0F1-type ATP synthase alpha subunit